jgi:chromosome segregation ATPase
MPEERFDRVDQEIGHVNERLDGVDQHLGQIDGRLDRVDERFDRVDGRLDRLEVGLEDLTGRVALRSDVAAFEAEVRNGVGTLREEMRATADELRRHMGVLHEEAMDRIAAMPESVDALRVEMTRGFADITEMIGRRLDPLETTVRQHSVDIEQLKQTRG